MNSNFVTQYAKHNAKKIRRLARVLSTRGDNRYCPICEHSSRFFLSTKHNRVEDALCPFCESLWRHRLVWRFFKEKTNLFDGCHNKKILHFAPEHCFQSRFKKIFGKRYITADLYEPSVDMKIDISNITFENDYFDVLYCSHVLEHVEDDIKAIRELYRVIKPGGWVLVIVPILAETTFEDRNVTNPKDRLRVFGQEDHIRICGKDYIDRFVDVGFDVEQFTAELLVAENEKERLGLANDNTVLYYCKKNEI